MILYSYSPSRPGIPWASLTMAVLAWAVVILTDLVLNP